MNPALDAKVRKDLRAWLRRLHDSSCHHSVCHHDQEEAMEVADEIVVMNPPSGTGRNASRDYDHPATAFVIALLVRTCCPAIADFPG